jgi:hypothetical protein
MIDILKIVKNCNCFPAQWAFTLEEILYQCNPIIHIELELIVSYERNGIVVSWGKGTDNCDDLLEIDIKWDDPSDIPTQIMIKRFFPIIFKRLNKTIEEEFKRKREEHGVNS